MGNRFGVRPPVNEDPAVQAVEAQHVKEITAADWEAEVVAAALPVALDFYGKASKPCEALAPRFAAVAERFAGKVRFLKMSLADHAPIAEKLGVKTSPTIVFLKGGAEGAERLTGDDIKRPDLKARVEAMLGVKPAAAPAPVPAPAT